MTIRILAAAVAAILPLGALHATTVVVPFSLAGFGNTPLLPAFDTSLGTLNSVAFTAQGSFKYSYTAVVGSSSDNELFLTPSVTTVLTLDLQTAGGDVGVFGNDITMSTFIAQNNLPTGQTINGSTNGGGSQSATFTNPAERDLFLAGVGAPRFGWIFIGTDPGNSSTGITSVTSNFSDYALTGSLTYNYTPFPVTPPGGVIPEPASWALMIAGFGLVGAAARRRPALARSHN